VDRALSRADIAALKGKSLDMMKRALKWLYRLGLRRDYPRVDRIRYLKRLEKGKHPLDDRYFVARDAEQFRAGAQVCIAADFMGKRVAFLCDPKNHFERLVIRQGFSGHAVLDHMAGFAAPGSAVLDVGANVGAYSVPLAAARPDLVVHAFEPNPTVVPRLERNRNLNRIANLVVHATALADAPGEASFYRFDDDVSLSSLNRHAAELHGTPLVTSVRVETVDALFARESRRVSFIKIDVQGAELGVLQGARDTIAAHRPAFLLEHEDSHFESPELAREHKAELAALLGGAGYRCFCLSRYDGRLMFQVDWNRPLHGDVLALPEG
jgi:FkbM family methyltransferase